MFSNIESSNDSDFGGWARLRGGKLANIKAMETTNLKVRKHPARGNLRVPQLSMELAEE